MGSHDVLLILVAFVSETIGTLSGFGSSTFFVPAALQLETFHFVLALTGILHCFGNIAKISLFRAHFDRRTFMLLFVPTVFLTGVGAALSAYYSAIVIRTSLGGLLIGIGAFSLLPIKSSRAPRWLAVVISAFSGLATGLVGTGGALRGVALKGLGIGKESFVIISAAIDLGGDLLRTSIYLKEGFMDWSQAFYIPLLGLSAYLGAKLGKKLLSRIRQEQFERIVAIFVLLSGIALVGDRS